MTDDAMMTWVKHYEDTLDKVRCLPGTVRSPEIMTRVWYAYLGGILLASGYQALGHFLAHVVDPSTQEPHSPGFSQNHSSALAPTGFCKNMWFRNTPIS